MSKPKKSKPPKVDSPKIMKKMTPLIGKLVQGIIGSGAKFTKEDCQTLVQFMSLRDDIIKMLEERVKKGG